MIEVNDEQLLKQPYGISFIFDDNCIDCRLTQFSKQLFPNNDTVDGIINVVNDEQFEKQYDGNSDILDGISIDVNDVQLPKQYDPIDVIVDGN